MTTLNLACVWGQSTAFINVPQSLASVSTENVVTITVRPGYPIDLMMVGTAAWTYRATTAVTTNDEPVAAGQPLTKRYYGTTTFYILRQSADGTVTFEPLAATKSLP